MSYLPTEGLLKIANEPLNSVVENYENVYVLHIDMDKLFIGSPLESFYQSGVLENSTFLSAHTSNIIRILAVWKYGGKYFDLDIVTIRNLTRINNYVIQEANFTDNNVANGAFAFQKHAKVGDLMLELLNENFITHEWTANGPIIITKAMRNYTGSETTTGMNKSNLKEIVMLKYETLFRINYVELLLYFDESRSDESMARI